MVSARNIVVLMIFEMAASGVRPGEPPSAKSPFDAGQAKKLQEHWAKYLERSTAESTSVGAKLALIPPGQFTMGSPLQEKGRKADEKPHEVRISRPFYLGACEITQAEYKKVMGINPSSFAPTGDRPHILERVKGLNTERFPVERVSWLDAVRFCNALSAKEGLKPYYAIEGKDVRRLGGSGYRLPTEAEWEYACRAGATTVFHYGDSLSARQANFDGNLPYGGAEKGPYLDRPANVGSYPPNAFGLYDMHGNIWEWCWDWYAADYYENSPATDPQGPDSGEQRVRRGGNFDYHSSLLRSADRVCFWPDRVNALNGFRIARSVE